MKTYTPKAGDIQRKWHLIDAQGKVLGRLASEVAFLLQGKLKTYYSPNVDVGDFVVVVNASGIRVTGDKLKKKVYFRHSGYPRGYKEGNAGGDEPQKACLGGRACGRGNAPQE